MKSKETKDLQMPPSFESDQHQAIAKTVGSIREKHDREWRSFAAAWNALKHRFRSAIEADATFSKSITRTKTPPPEERYLQEDALFHFFASTCSSIELFYFACYCIGTIIDPEAFPMAEPESLRVYPRHVSIAYRKRFPGAELSSVLKTCLSGSEFRTVVELRNFLSHRGSLPRLSHLGGDKDGSTFVPTNPQGLADSWVYDLEVSESSTSTSRNWLESTLSVLIRELHSFVGRELMNLAA